MRFRSRATRRATMEIGRRPRLGRVATAVSVATVLAVAVAGCSSSDGSANGGSMGTGSTQTGTGRTPATATGTTVDRPDGPVGELAPLSGGKGVWLASAGNGPDLAAAGYREDEFTVSGTATSYTADALPADGHFQLSPGPTAPYVTRIVVRRPIDPARFNGTVAVEWLNVSGGVDTGADYTYLAPELLRQGYVWVGVSAQRIGVEGGRIAVTAPGAEESGAGKGIKNIDPDRYGTLSHPGDAFAFDIYTQVARALREPSDTDALDGLTAERLLAVGESQSAFLLTTYYDGVQPLTEAYDGFFIHSRGGAAAPVASASGAIDIAGSLSGQPTRLRDDQRAPAIVIQTETDVIGLLGYLPARQPDNDRLRVWEVAGAAHADKDQVGETEAMLGCSGPINRSQQAFVLRAGLRQLDRWVTDGTAPSRGEPLQVDETGEDAVLVLDEVGNAKGGVRTPVVDAPVDVLSGLAPEGSSIICILFGSTTPLPADRLAALYSSRDEYETRYEQATDAAIDAGFILGDDREAVLDGAAPDRIA